MWFLLSSQANPPLDNTVHSLLVTPNSVGNPTHLQSFEFDFGGFHKFVEGEGALKLAGRGITKIG